MTPTVDQADSYHALRRNSEWLEVDSFFKAPALYRAGDYIRAIYAVDGHESDPLVQEAIIVLAPLMVANPATITAPDREVLTEERGYGNGAVETKTVYAKSASNDPYPLITAMLSQYGKRRERGGRTLSFLRLSRD